MVWHGVTGFRRVPVFAHHVMSPNGLSFDYRPTSLGVEGHGNLFEGTNAQTPFIHRSTDLSPGNPSFTVSLLGIP